MKWKTINIGIKHVPVSPVNKIYGLMVIWFIIDHDTTSYCINRSNSIFSFNFGLVQFDSIKVFLDFLNNWLGFITINRSWFICDDTRWKCFQWPINDSETVNGLWFWTHDESFCLSVWSVLRFAFPISVCCSLDVKCSDVFDVIVSWIAAHSWAVWTHWSLALLLKPLPLVKPPQPFIDIIITCSITRSDHSPAHKQSLHLIVK